jgi:hypothetical protein
MLSFSRFRCDPSPLARVRGSPTRRRGDMGPCGHARMHGAVSAPPAARRTCINTCFASRRALALGGAVVKTAVLPSPRVVLTGTTVLPSPTLCERLLLPVRQPPHAPLARVCVSHAHTTWPCGHLHIWCGVWCVYAVFDVSLCHPTPPHPTPIARAGLLLSRDECLDRVRRFASSAYITEHHSSENMYHHHACAPPPGVITRRRGVAVRGVLGSLCTRLPGAEAGHRCCGRVLRARTAGLAGPVVCVRVTPGSLWPLEFTCALDLGPDSCVDTRLASWYPGTGFCCVCCTVRRACFVLCGALRKAPSARRSVHVPVRCARVAAWSNTSPSSFRCWMACGVVRLCCAWDAVFAASRGAACGPTAVHARDACLPLTDAGVGLAARVPVSAVVVACLLLGLHGAVEWRRGVGVYGVVGVVVFSVRVVLGVVCGLCEPVCAFRVL